MEEEYKVDKEFLIKVSEVAKLIQERITKNVYKFKIEASEENPDQDFYLRFNCVQGWFIRCSFKSKVGFLKECAWHVNDLNLLITIINTLYTVSSKDRIYSLARGNFQAIDMKLLPDNNRCLDTITLKKVMTNEINWFKTLSTTKQYIFLIKLITLADGLVVINNIFAHFIEILINRTKITSTNIFPTALNTSTVDSVLLDQNEEDLKKTIQEHFNEMFPGSIVEHVSHNELQILTMKWKQFITRYTEIVNSTSPSPPSSPNPDDEPKDKKNVVIDSIQKHPLWVTMPICAQLHSLPIMGKVNEFWAATTKEFKSELGARKLLNKDIIALEDQIKTFNVNTNITYELPDLRDKVTDITKPSFRKKFNSDNVVTDISLISEVYKDYLVDPNSKKLQSFPRAISLKNNLNTCNNNNK